MILFTSITSPMLVQKFAPKLKEQNEDIEIKPLFKRILVPISNPATEQNLITMANLLTAESSGTVLAVNVARESPSVLYEFKKQKELLEKIPDLLDDPESQIELIPRLANTYAEGILMTSKERDATIILMGWRGKRNIQQNILGSILDEVIWGSDLPVMVGKLPQNVLGMQRVLLLLPEKIVANEVLRRIIKANVTIAKSINVPLEILAAANFLPRINEILSDSEIEIDVKLKKMEGTLRITDLHKHAESDLLVIPGYGSRQRFLAHLGNLPERLAAEFNGNIILLHFDR